MMIHIAADDSRSHLSGFNPQDVQPNAIDLRLDRVFEMVDESPFRLTEEEKTHREKQEVQSRRDGIFVLRPHSSYEVTFEGIITIGSEEAGFVITRSTLNRNGLFLTSGLYDSGYVGAMAGMLHNLGSWAYIKRGTRIGQFLLWKAQALHDYQGSYGFNADGTVKQEEARYHL